MSDKLKNAESSKESSVELSALNFSFCPDEEITKHYQEQLEDLRDKDKWLAANKEKIAQSKDRIAEYIKDGLMPDDKPESIWRFSVDRIKESESRTIEVKKELEPKTGEIRNAVSGRLAKFLPDWACKGADVNFAINEKSDFWVNDNVITADLTRLAFDKDFVETAVEGTTHEVFHIWMQEGRPSTGRPKEEIIFSTIDEGLAVLVSGQSLQKHHEHQGRNYQEYVQESFDAFNKFLREKNKGKIKKMVAEGGDGYEFKNMGHFYVVGHEIASAVLENLGIEEFRKIILEARDNPRVLLEAYEVICSKDSELPKIIEESK